jgi:hypothetical protein
MIRRFAVAVVFVGSVAGASWSVPPASAAQPSFFSASIDRTIASPFYSAACGFEVDVTTTGTVKGVALTDADGSVIREIDTQPGARITFSSPATAGSFSFPWATTYTYRYIEGTDPGDHAIVTANGLAGKVPGIGADAGVITFGDAVVLFVDPSSGFPIVDFGAPTGFSGHVNEPLAEIAAGCAVLAAG